MSNLPDSWIYANLSEVAFIQMGQSPNSRSYNETGEGLPFFQGKADFGDLFPTPRKWCTEPKKVAEVGEILLSVRAPVGPTNLADERCCIGRGLASIRAVPPFNQKYLLHFFRSIELRLSQQGTGTTFTGIGSREIQQVEVPIAPLDEQERIVDKLDSLLARVDKCCDRLNRVSDILRRFREAILMKATSGELTKDWRDEYQRQSQKSEIDQLVALDIPEADCFNDFRFPKSWSVSRLGEISQVSGGIMKNSKKQDPNDEELPYLRVANVQRGFFDLSEIKTIRVPHHRVEELLLKPRDILFNEGGDIDKLGRGWVWNGEVERCTFQNHVFRVRLNNSLFEPKFFSWYGNSRGADYFLSMGKQTTNLASINKSRLSALPVVIPPPEEQREIVQRVESLLTYADHLEIRHGNTLAKVEQLIPILLNKAFSGKLTTQDFQEEQASVLLERIQSEKSRLSSKRKTKITIQRQAKEKSKAPMKTPSDYLKSLSSAFAESPGNNARQLFNQAGFSPEEVVEFYEALRIAPEVSSAFKQSRPDLPPTQKSLAIRTNEKVAGDEKFRLIDLWLEEFKNLIDYTVRFDDSHSIDIVLGWNGTGKSNLFEALVVIFRDLHEWSSGKPWTKKPLKGFRLRYKISEQLVDITWRSQEMRSPLLKTGSVQEGKKEPEKLTKIAKRKLLLPRFVFGYYSGPTNRLAEHFLPMNQNHYNSLRDEPSDDPETLTQLLENRRFFCAENRHAKYVLLAFFHKEDSAISEFLEKRLRIVGFESALFVIRKPRWAKQGAKAEDFWGARGVMRRVIERLRRFAIAPMVVEQNVREGYSLKSEEHYYFFLPDLQSLHALAAEYQDARTFFLALESIDFSELIYDLKIQVRVQSTKTEQVAITFHELSEGEQQLLMVLGLMRFTKSHQSLVLLDEPDTHLNPHWSVDYLKLLSHVMSETTDESEEQQTSQILMSTHDPLVIASLLKEQIHLLKRDWQTDVCKWEQPTVDPRGLGFTGILTSEMFGMRSDLDEETLADLDNKVRLIAKEGLLTKEEDKEFEEINKRLEDAGFQKAFSDPYYAAFARAWGKRHTDLMAGARFLSLEQKEEIDQISSRLLEEAIAELEAEASS